ncbi:MAG: hypothetical protein ACTSRZ_07205 [Promethearchaeota archaeon]
MVLFEIVFNELLVYKIMDSICELATFALSFISFKLIFKKWKENRKRTSFYLLLIFLALAISPIAQFIDGLFYTGWGADNTFGLYDAQIGYALILIFTAIANIGLLNFALDIFIHEELKATQRRISNLRIVRIVSSILLGVLGGLGGILKLQSMDVTIIIGLYFIIAMVIYIFLGTNAYKLARRVEPGIFRTSIRYIGHFAFSLLGVYIFFILDSFYTTYTIWGFFGWALFFIATYLGYIGFALPIKKSQNIK